MTLPSYSNTNRAEFGFLALGLLAAVLPAITPERATDFLGLKGIGGSSLIGYP